MIAIIRAVFSGASSWDEFKLNMAKASVQSATGDRLRVYRKLGSLARSGVPLPKALESMWNLSSKNGKNASDPMAICLEEWKNRVNNGETLGEAINGWVPPSERMLIDAAGAARLDVALENTAEVVQATKAMKAAVVGGMAYPGFLLAGVGVVLWVFGMKVIPAFDSVKPMEEWTGMAASMAWLSKVIDQAAIPVIAGFLAIMTICMMSLGRWKGPIRIFCDQRVPPWSIYRLFVGSGFLLSLSALIKAGVPVPEALRRLKSAATPWLMERLDTFIYHTNEGQQLGEAMYLSKFQFPDEEIIEDLRLYASLGSFDERMENMAREWISEGVAKVQAQAQMLNMAMMVLVGLCVAWMGAGLLAIQQQVTSL